MNLSLNYSKKKKKTFCSFHKISIFIVYMTTGIKNSFLDILSSNIKPNKLIWLSHEGDLHFAKAYMQHSNKEKESNKKSAFLLLSKQLFDQTKTLIFIKNSYILHQFQHPAILPFDFLSISPNNTLDTYYKYPENGKLSDYIGFSHENCNLKFDILTSTQKTIISYGIAHALRYIHHHNIQFNKVNARNVYLNEKFHPLLINFLSIKKIKNTCFLKIDVYAYSFIYAALIEPITLDPPAKSADDFFKRLNRHQRPVCKNASEKQRKVLEMMWDRNPSDRISFDQVINYFEQGDLVFPGTNLQEFDEYKKHCNRNSIELVLDMTRNFERTQKEACENPIQKEKEKISKTVSKSLIKSNYEEDEMQRNRGNPHISSYKSSDEERMQIKKDYEENYIDKNQKNSAHCSLKLTSETKIPTNVNNEGVMFCINNCQENIQKKNKDSFNDGYMSIVEATFQNKDNESDTINVDKNEALNDNENDKINDDKNEVLNDNKNGIQNDDKNEALNDNENNKIKDDKNKVINDNEKEFLRKDNKKERLNKNDTSHQDQVFDLQNYIKNEKIGQGGFCKVYKITDKKTGEIYSAKILNKIINQNNNYEMNDLIQEVSIISSFHHPTILEFIGFSIIDFKKRPKPVIITKYYPKGSLKDVIIKNENDEWDDTKKLISIYGIASAISYMHSNNVIHRDLKPNNILSDDELKPKIADFGLSEMIPKNETGMSFTESILCGTPEYIAPEIWQKKEYSKASDVYAFSLIVYEMITNEPPFPKDLNCIQIVYQVLKKNYRPTLDKPIPSSYKKLIESCWKSDPKERPSFDEIISLLHKDSGFLTSKIDKTKFEKFVEKINGSSKSINENELILKKQRFQEYMDKIKIIIEEEELNLPEFPRNIFHVTGNGEDIKIEEEKSMKNKRFDKISESIHIDVNSDDGETFEKKSYRFQNWFRKRKYGINSNDDKKHEMESASEGFEDNSNNEENTDDEEKHGITPFEDFVSEDFEDNSNNEENTDDEENHRTTLSMESASEGFEDNSNNEENSDDEEKNEIKPSKKFVSENYNNYSDNEGTSDNVEIHHTKSSEKNSSDTNSTNVEESLENEHQLEYSDNFAFENENENIIPANEEIYEEDENESNNTKVGSENDNYNNSSRMIEIHYKDESESRKLFKMGNYYYKKDKNFYFYLAKAFDYYKQAADLGHTDAMNNAGLMLIKGKGTYVNKKLGIEYLAKAANKGNMIAMCNFMKKLNQGEDCSDFL